LYQVGGIAGKNVGSINNCYNTGTINGVTYSSVNTGGIAGFNVTDDAVIDNCYNTGTINGIHFSGGIAGENYDNAIVTNCYNLGTINDNNYSGGIAGYNYWSAIISKCHNTGVVNGSNNAGGIAGFNSSAKISDCYNASELNSGSYTGGITGYNNSGAIERCYNYASIAGSTRAGGIVGYNHGSNANISYCYNLSTITGSYSGGIVGQNYYYSNTSNCFNTGNINGSYAGGIAGDNDTNASVNDCYNTASVSGSTSITYTGGVIGKNTGIVNNCYNIGAISGTYPGGIAGYNSNSISYCYFLNNILKGIGTGNGTATTYSCTLAQMQQQSTFTGFDFTNNWVIPGSNSTPYLRAFYIPVSGIILNDSADSLLIGESVTLSADIQPINATNKNITWSSSNTNIATVSDAGLVNGISKGAVTITATTDDGNLIAQRTLEIIQPVTGISLNTSSEELEIGNQLQLTPTVLPANASDTSVTWTSSNTSIATVSNTGLVTAVRSGEAQITVTTSDGEKTAVCDVKVLGMAVTTSPKIIFYKGEPFDTTGGILTIYKPSDVQETVYLIPDMVTGYDNSILGNQTLTVTYGEYTATYDISVNYANVSFDTKGGSAIDSINADYNTIISKPTQPQKTGYAFDGWYADEQLTDLWIFSEDKVTQDTTLYAKWSICSYNVTFDSKGGSEVIGFENQVFNSLITAPTEPSKQHYSFAGWFKEDSCTNPWNFDTDTVPGDSFTLYAKWTPDLHTINGLANNSSYGTITGAGQFGYDSQATLTAVPNEKYRFICWTDNGEEVSSNYAYTSTVTGDHTVVAVFDVILTPVLSSAVSAGYNSICLTWSAVDGASGYDIYRSLSSTGTYDKIGASDTTDFTDSNLTPGKYYYYKIKAVYSAGEVKTYSSFSEYLSAKPIPSAPTINVSSYSYTSLQLSWSAIDGANGYQIYRSLSSTGTYSLVATTSLTSYINSGLVTGKNYYYKVIAYTTVGSSKIYGAYSLPMYAKPVPPAPNASCVSAGFNSIKISWASVSGATKYEIYRSPNDIGTYTLIASTTLASYIDKDLAAGLMYYYKVIAYHLEGTVKVYGSYSSSVSAIPVPLAPVAKAQSASYNSINITWNEIVGANWYEVYQIDNQTLNDDLIATISSTSYLHKNLTPGASYSYKIRAYRVSGFGELYSPYSEETTAVPVPSTPAIKVTLKSYNSLNISWDEIEGADGYEIYRSTSISGSYNFHDTTTALSYDDTSLTTGYTYYYKVKAYHSDNPKIFGNESNIASLKVIPTTPVVSVSPASYNSLSLSWDSVAGATGYRIYRSTSSSGTYASLTTVTSGTSYINSGLATGTTYYYKILAYRTEGTVITNSAYSAVKYAKVVPATPDGVSAQSASAASIKITWNKVSGASGYTIYRLSSTGTYPSIATVTSSYNYYTNAGLITGTTYYYKVASYRLVGTTKVYGTASEIVSAAPESSLPQAMSLLNPPKITVSPASYNSLIISWDAVDGATGYEISKSTSSTNGFEPIKITDALNYTDNDLITGITYNYKVRALINGDPIVYGDYSAVSGLKPIPATPVITVTPTQYNSLSISWEAVDGATGYKIYRSTSKTGTYAYVTAITYGTSYVNTGLATGTTYYYKVLAYRTEGTVTTNSLYSAYKYAKVIPSAPIATAASYNYNSVKISWPKVSGASGYTIYRCATETGTYAALITTSLNSYTNTSLATGSTWYYTVAAYRLLGTTKVYGLKSEATSAAPVPSTPVPTAVSTGYNSIKISWPAVAGASAYEVYSAGESDTFLARVTTPYFTQADLTPGTSYSYKVVAYKTMASGDVYGVYSNIVTASPVPSAPTTSVLLNTYNSLNIKWNEIDGADKYEISRSASSKGIFEPIGESDTTDFIDNSLITGATYYYKVRAFIETDQKVYGDYSAIVSSKALPAAPVVTVTPTAYNSLSLSWNSQDGVTGYRIYRSTSKTGTYALVKTTTETSFINTSLAAGTTYYYKLIAVRTDGAVTTLSPYSAVKYAKVIPASPTGVSAQSASYNSIKVTWDKVSGVSGYTVYRLASNGTYPAIATVTTNSYTNTGLTTGTTYTYKVAAYRLAGTTKVYGGYSEIVSDCPKPAIPAPSAVSAGYNSVYLSWSAISGASGYEVYLTDPQTQTDKQLTSTSSLNYKHSSLITNKQYSYKVRSYTTLGDNTVFGAYSSIISATPIPSTPKISVDLNTINSIKISWEPVGGAEGYEVLRSSTIDGTYEIISTISDTEYVDTGLTLQNSYYYKVRAYITDDADNIYSEYSSPTGRVMLPKTPSLSAASYSYNCIQLTWDSIDGATGYKIYRSTSSSGTYSIIYTITDGSTSYINPGLTSGTAYYYKVKTYTTTPNGEVYSDYSANASARPYVTAPIITTSVPIYNNIRIDWSAVEGASGYQVYRATTLDGTYSLIADTKSSVLNYTNTGLAMDKTYYYKVRAYRTVGTTKVGGFYSDIESNKTRQPLKPELKLLFLTSDEDVMYPDYVGFYVFNNGPVTLTIYSQNALLYDYEYYFYDSALILADEEYVYNYVQFGPSEDGLVSFYTLEWPTRYDEYSKIYFDFKYDGIMYRGYVSNYFGFHYYKK
ncbi:MAG: fibronectin type III domain-containing protein, partial [Eubacteriaceae bacterium]